MKLDGIVNIIKPPGISSHQVVSILRRLLQIRKIGHTGTLDPGAAGVLSLCVGRATRLSQYLLDKDKRYTAELTLGITTDTQDASGSTEEIITDFSITPQRFADTLHKFLGRIEQTPPPTSAVRINGERAYKKARRGEAVQVPSRTVTIYALHVNKVFPEGSTGLHFGSRILLDVHCSKGTYIRTLCSDIGRELQVGAHMSFLTRTQSGVFSLAECYTLEEVAALVEAGDYCFLRPMEAGLPNWPRVRVSPLAEARVQNGNFCAAEELMDVPEALILGDEVLILGLDGEALGLGRIEKHPTDQGLICQPFRVLKG